MATFTSTITAGGSPTPFGIFDGEKDFQIDADSMVTFVKRKLGDDILSVELTNKQIWMSFEESALEYSRIVNEYQTKSQLANLLGNDLNKQDEGEGNIDGGPQGAESKFPRETLEFLMRKAEPYASHAATGGSYNIYSGSISLVDGQQDYNVYTDLMMDVSGAKFDAEDDFEVRLALAPPKLGQIDKKLIFQSNVFVDLFFRRRKMKRRTSSETCFPKVSRRSEPCLKGKRPFEVSIFIFSFFF